MLNKIYQNLSCIAILWEQSHINSIQGQLKGLSEKTHSHYWLKGFWLSTKRSDMQNRNVLDLKSTGWFLWEKEIMIYLKLTNAKIT